MVGPFAYAGGAMTDATNGLSAPTTRTRATGRARRLEIRPSFPVGLGGPEARRESTETSVYIVRSPWVAGVGKEQFCFSRFDQAAWLVLRREEKGTVMRDA